MNRRCSRRLRRLPRRRPSSSCAAPPRRAPRGAARRTGWRTRRSPAYTRGTAPPYRPSPPAPSLRVRKGERVR